MYQQKDLTGSIWMDVKQRDGVNGTYSFYSGNCLVVGQEYWINAYPKTVQTKTGEKQVLNLTFQLKTKTNNL